MLWQMEKKTENFGTTYDFFDARIALLVTECAVYKNFPFFFLILICWIPKD